MIARRKTGNRRRTGLLLLLVLTVASALGESKQRVFQLSGKIVQSDGKPFRYVAVILFSATTPFHARTLADAGGDFKFKGLSPGTYNLYVAAARVGEIEETIDVGPSLADKKGEGHNKSGFRSG